MRTATKQARGRGRVGGLPKGYGPLPGKAPSFPIGTGSTPEAPAKPASSFPMPSTKLANLPPGMNKGGPGNGGTSAPASQRTGRGRQAPGQGAPPAPKGQSQGLGGGGLAGPGGRQLQARVSSGKITEEQAQRTMQQRQTLKKAFGKDWRDKLSGGGQSFAQVNQGLKKTPGDPKLAALRKKLIEGRKSLLTAAKASPTDATPPAPKGKKRGKKKTPANDYPGESD